MQEQVWNLKGEETKASISSFKGKTTLNLRKYFKDKSGEWKPTKKGINLTKEAWNKIVENVQLIDQNF